MQYLLRWLAHFGTRLAVGLFHFVPFWMLYRISNGLRFFLQHVVKYRSSVVKSNLQRAFPKKNEAEIQNLTSHFYINLTDILLESVKGLSMTKQELTTRYIYKGVAEVEKCLQEGRSCLLAGSHCANWEWAMLTMGTWTSSPVFSVYKPLSNKWTDEFMATQRKRFGTRLVSMAQTGRAIVQQRQEPSVFVLASDQTPSDLNHAYWINFLNQETPFVHGLEKLARKFNYPVFFIETIRTKRGHYQMTYHLLSKNPKDTQDGELTLLFAKRLEQAILKHPADWLWSHKRWKHKRTKRNTSVL